MEKMTEEKMLNKINEMLDKENLSVLELQVLISAYKNLTEKNPEESFMPIYEKIMELTKEKTNDNISRVS